MKPNLFIVGAAKSGTTMLYHILNQHEEVFLSEVKEPAYIALSENKEYIKNKDSRKWQTQFSTDQEYYNLFSSAKKHKAIGEASTCYLYVPGTARKIKEMSPDAKIVIILRNPTSRAYSSYQHVVRDGEETELDFLTALEKENKYISEDYAMRWRYIDGGMYSRQVKEYQDIFSKEQIKVIIFEEFIRSKQQHLADLLAFLDVQPQGNIDIDKVVNISGVFNNKIIANAYRILKNPPLIGRVFYRFDLTRRIVNEVLFTLERKYLVKRKMNSQEISQLDKVFEKDILDLEILLGRKIDVWRGE